MLSPPQQRLFMPPPDNGETPVHTPAGDSYLGHAFAAMHQHPPGGQGQSNFGSNDDGDYDGNERGGRDRGGRAPISLPLSALIPAKSATSYVHKLLAQPWLVFFVASIFAYVLLAVMAGVLLLAVAGNIESTSVLFERAMLGAAEGSHNATNTNPLAAMDLWEKVFFLGSGNILGANGIGDIVATDTRGYGISFVQQLIGIFMQSFLGAFILLKLTSPKMQVLFSDRGLISVRNGIPVLVFRIGDKQNPNRLPETVISMKATIPSISEEGEAILIDAALATQRSGVSMDALTISHSLTPDSPLFGISRSSLAPGGVFENIMISIEIMHENALFGGRTPRTYTAEDLLTGMFAFHPMDPKQSFWDGTDELNREDFNRIYTLQDPKQSDS